MVFYMCVYCYYVIITFYYKVNDSRKKKKKANNCSNIWLVKETHGLLFMYGWVWLCWLTINMVPVRWVFSFILKYYYKNNDRLTIA